MNKYGNITYTIGIWSGFDQTDRLVAQARSWFRSFSDVLVFTEMTHPWDSDKIKREALPCNVTIIDLGFGYGRSVRRAGYFSGRLEAQFRFLPGMQAAYERFPNASFYVFGDDDTYFFKPSLIKLLNSSNPNISKAYGRSYCSSDITKLMKPSPNYWSCRHFLQGGAGVVFTNNLFERIGPKLINCSEKFNSPYFVASMRFALCAARYIGSDEWEHRIADNMQNVFHSEIPDLEVPKYGLSEPPITFHKMTKATFDETFKARYVKYKIKRKKFLADLGEITYTSQDIYMLNNNYRLSYRPGMSIYVPYTGEMFNRTSKWKPIIENISLVGAEQRYGKFTVRLLFDENISFGKIIPHSNYPRNNIFIYKMQKPEIIPLN
ncbi:hypothetical protein TVAG_235630 [Trichomonas vaginalis G3]|uniref:N-acetylgalactosaminide beta-1,3-galactosyltransferase n=1 Tax=Trichomonas vaginalis (strain ATCC PRA-98 / G3) TaxID=412133 RepID=A2FWM2_TRIV3|nr:glycosyltransferase family 31 protein family [Trichomonas vaginalis G3]EAX90682.1 hypothetical protein TVAG_235630 [Trichomonas vaginalis G3]KAI5530982.1 glycosyltransferase family 31 protein family [Trichomonas vaginalis G3]|eukprot:XP_001303612.1 hypothetical protein [Trichomonas vaginalis G3]